MIPPFPDFPPPPQASLTRSPKIPDHPHPAEKIATKLSETLEAAMQF